MSDHWHHHHHNHRHPGHAHPPAAVHSSILRLSMLERMAAAGAVIAAIWLIVVWAIR